MTSMIINFNSDVLSWLKVSLFLIKRIKLFLIFLYYYIIV